MLHLRYYPFELAFEYPFTISKGTKTHQPTLVVALGLGSLTGFGEAPAISYYNVTVQGMIDALEAKRGVIERYALMDPQRFWHFLHHLLPGNEFLIAALDIAGWDLFAKMRRKPLHQLLGLKWENLPITDYTIGLDTAETMIEKLKAHPWPLYKIKLGRADDIDLLRALRQHTEAPFRVDANEGWTFDEAKQLLPELVKLGVNMVEQPLSRKENEAMKELKAFSPLPLFADESCVTEEDVKACADGFHGINIKLTKCGGITPALRMEQEARKLGLKVMMGSMNESTVGSAAIAHLMPILDEVDVDGPLLLKEDIAEGLTYENGKVNVSQYTGLGVGFKGVKFEKNQFRN
ncbi:MAG: dipeptide epimerase [Flavipsychrobacter sp.]|jgi:L-alanine-DL-glutamate epimerase-like enolase superfamily enzyme|nr:dipeptide epimerase [Flavipsychrobacter sp.]